MKQLHLKFFAALVLFAGALSAEWNLQECLPEINMQTIQDQKFTNLKAEVTKYLSGSWCSEEKVNLLMDLVAFTKPAVCVEIGAFSGSSVLPVAATLKYLGSGKILAIDAWSNQEAIKYLEDEDPNKAWWATVDMNSAYSTFQKTINSWKIKPYCTVIQSPSEQALAKIDAIDFLHLDGDFSEGGSTRDVQQYLPKVKSGGYVLLSNALVTCGGVLTKMDAFMYLFDECDYVCDIDKQNTALFRKK